jgi:hypothetical protein
MSIGNALAQYSWKDEIREAIDQSKATNMDEFKEHLSQYGIEVIIFT